MSMKLFTALLAFALLVGCQQQSTQPVADLATESPVPENGSDSDAQASGGGVGEGADEGAKKTADAETKSFRPRSRIRGGGVMDLVFDDLQFDIEADADFDREMLTDEIEELHEKSVILRGFILDTSVFQRTGIKEFVLIRDNQECCFGPGAKVHHNVWVNMDEGQTTKFSFRPVEVHGKFSIRPWHSPEDGKCYSVYHLQASKVKPAS